ACSCRVWRRHDVPERAEPGADGSLVSGSEDQQTVACKVAELAELAVTDQQSSRLRVGTLDQPGSPEVTEALRPVSQVGEEYADCRGQRAVPPGGQELLQLGQSQATLDCFQDLLPIQSPD